MLALYLISLGIRSSLATVHAMRRTTLYFVFQSHIMDSDLSVVGVMRSCATGCDRYTTDFLHWRPYLVTCTSKLSYQIWQIFGAVHLHLPSSLWSACQPL